MVSALAYRSNQQGPSLDVTRKSALLMATDSFGLFADGTRISPRQVNGECSVSRRLLALQL